MLRGKSGFISSPLQIGGVIFWSLFLTLSFSELDTAVIACFDPACGRGSLPRGEDTEAARICDTR